MEIQINKILVEVLNVTSEQVLKDLTMDDIGTWDSLTHMDLIVALEDALGIELSGDDIAEMISFNAIRTIVGKYCQ